MDSLGSLIVLITLSSMSLIPCLFLGLSKHVLFVLERMNECLMSEILDVVEDKVKVKAVDCKVSPQDIVHLRALLDKTGDPAVW